MKSLLRVLFASFSLSLLFGCGESHIDPTGLTVEQYATALGTISAVDFSSKYTADIRLPQKMTWGTKQDWNSFAGQVGRIGQKLLAGKPEVQRLLIRAYDGDTQWAIYVVERKELPKGWEQATYLEFFSFGDASGGILQEIQTLCDFYREYESSRPPNALVNCRK